jgi:hypothetical protein
VTKHSEKQARHTQISGGIGIVPEEGIQKWRAWIEQNFGGPPERVDAAAEAAVGAMNAGERSTDRIVAAARGAAAAWDAQHPEPQAIDDRPAPAPGFLRGRAAAVQQRFEVRRFYMTGQGVPPPSNLILDFRLQPSGPAGAAIGTIAVELVSAGSVFRTSKGIEGSIFNGDEVEVDGRNYKSGKTLQVKQVRNFTSSSIVRVRGSSPLPIFADPRAEKYTLLRGRITALQQGSDIFDSRFLFWTFRLQRATADGRLLPAVEIEMRNRGFEGTVSEGDAVELDAKGFKVGDIVKVKQLRNLSSNSVVQAR